jgi:hypothetical protein
MPFPLIMNIVVECQDCDFIKTYDDGRKELVRAQSTARHHATTMGHHVAQSSERVFYYGSPSKRDTEARCGP